MPHNQYILNFTKSSVKHENEWSLTLFEREEERERAEEELHNVAVCSLHAIVEVCACASVLLVAVAVKQTKTMINLLRMFYCVCVFGRTHL